MGEEYRLVRRASVAPGRQNAGFGPLSYCEQSYARQRERLAIVARTAPMVYSAPWTSQYHSRAERVRWLWSGCVRD